MLSRVTFASNGGCGNGVAPAIAFDQRCMGKTQRFHRPAVDQHMLWLGIKLIERQLHGAVRSLKNIDLVDGINVNAGNAVTDFRVRSDDLIKTFAFFKGELFGIVKTAQFPVEAILQPLARKQYGGRYDRARERTAAGLIHAGDIRNALGPKVAFKAQAFPVFRTHVPALEK